MSYDQKPKSRTAIEIAGDLARNSQSIGREAAICIAELVEMILAYQDVCVAYRTGRQTIATERALELIQRHKWRVGKPEAGE